MSDLVYAALVIIIIWAGIFFYLVGLERRLKRLEKMLEGGSTPAGAEHPPAPVETWAESDSESGTTGEPAEG